MTILAQLEALRTTLAAWNAANMRARREYHARPTAFSEPSIAWPADPRHGSNAGWKAHEREAVTMCEPCNEVRRADQAAQRRRQRAKKRARDA